MSRVLGRKIGIFSIVAVLLLASIALPLNASAVSRAELNATRRKIAALNAKIAAYNNKSAELAQKSRDINTALESLNLQIKTLETEIELKNAEHSKLLNDIEVAKQRIETNKKLISILLAQFYYNDEVTTIERLFSMKNLSTYINQEMQYSSMADSLSNIIKENQSLKKQLELDEAKAKQHLADLNNQNAALAAKKAEQQNLYNQTQSEQNDNNALKAISEAEQKQLRAQEAQQQKAIEALFIAPGRSGGSNSSSPISPGNPAKGRYPYSGRCPRSKDAFADRWGMYICECVSYTAWRVHDAYGNMPYWGGSGHAKQWPANARRAGFRVDNNPTPGSVGISYSGPFGHAVWVERVEGNRVYISQYNAWPRRGDYSEAWAKASSFTYIHFR